MSYEIAFLVIYRLMALLIAAMMIWVLFRERDWPQQVFAAIVLVPFALRAAGLK